MNYFNENELNSNKDAIEQLEKNIHDLKIKMMLNNCDKPKNIGDKVIVWDGSYNQNIKTKQKYSGIDKIFTEPLIIIDDKYQHKLEINYFKKKEINLNLLLYSPTFKQKIATTSSMVRVI